MFAVSRFNQPVAAGRLILEQGSLSASHENGHTTDYIICGVVDAVDEGGISAKRTFDVNGPFISVLVLLSYEFQLLCCCKAAVIYGRK